MANNPCGLSYERTIQIIKDNVLTGGYNGRSEVMKGLMNDGFAYDEAKAVTDQYFQIYRRVSDSSKSPITLVPLTGKQKADKKLNDLAVDYLNGNLQGFPMTDVDIEALEKIYAKADKAQTPTLKEKYNEEASVFAQRFMPGYSNELFKTSVYARPLLSAIFFIKSFLSNIHGQVERTITDISWDGKSVDFTSLGKFMGLANASGLNVIKGGIPATSLYQNEAVAGGNKGRLEEFPIEGTEANSNPIKGGYYRAMNFMSKFSNRFNASPDTWGIFSNAERHFYQLLKEKYRADGLSNEAAKQEALKQMDLSDEATAVRMATAKFAELGLPTQGKGGKNTSEFNVAVAEYRRMHRDQTIWDKSITLAKNDFWKRNMTQASELGFGDYGLFGLKAQGISALRDKVEKTWSKSKLASSLNLFTFGFLNGAANFAEDALERIPAYALIKVGFLQARKSEVTDAELHNDIARRQRDIIVKNIATAGFFVAARMAEKALCPEYSGRQSSSEVSGGRTQIGLCGIPAIVPPQMLAAYKAYKILEESFESDAEFFEAAMHILPVLVQSNQIGLGGALDKIGTSVTEMGVASSRGDEVKVSEEYSKLGATIIKSGVDVANSYLPIPSRVLNEIGAVGQRSIWDAGQKTQQLPFAIDEMGNKMGVFRSIGKVTIAALGSVTGVSEVANAALGSQKTYATDWMGRKVMQFRGSDIIGSGIQYTMADDILASASVRAPYVNRLTKITVSEDSRDIVDFSGKPLTEKVKQVRYMTDEEFFNVSVALGEFNKEYFEEKQDGMRDVVKESKSSAKKLLIGVFESTKRTAIKAVESGITGKDEILQHVKENWETERKKEFTSKELNEPE